MKSKKNKRKIIEFTSLDMAILDFMAYGKRIERAIMWALHRIEFGYYKEALPEIAQLLHLLGTGSCFYRDAYIHLSSEERKSCRAIGGVEHLFIASLLIESYFDMEKRCSIIMKDYNLKKPTDVVFAWDKLCQAYKNAVYAILVRIDFNLAKQWRKGDMTWQVIEEEIDKKRLTLQHAYRKLCTYVERPIGRAR